MTTAAQSAQAAAASSGGPAGRKRMIVDAQVHVWKAETPDWPGFRRLPQMPEPFTIEKLVPLMERPASTGPYRPAGLARLPQRLWA